MPVGVTVTTDVMQPSGSLDTATAAQLFLSGLCERGDTAAPIVARNMTELQALTGGRVTYGAIYDAAQAYFGEGGSRVVVARKVGAAATKGAVTLPDRAGSPVSTLTMTAQSAGAWSSNVTVTVADGLLANTVTVTVTCSGVGGTTEVYQNLANPAAVVAALKASNFVRATDLGSATAAPSNNPAVGTYTLTAGSDDRASVAASDLVTGLTLFTTDMGPGMVAIPGQPYSTVAAGIAAHCAANGRVGAVAAAQGTTVASAITAARSLRTTTGSEGLGFFYPWVQIPDGAGGVRTISPEGYVAGVRARSILAAGGAVGPWFGESAKAKFVSGAELTLSSADASSLADGAVNPIRVMLGGVRLYDWRSLSADEANWRFLNYRDMVNEIGWRLERRLESVVGRLIDGKGHLFSEMETAGMAILEPNRSAGALYELVDGAGTTIDPGYKVVTAAPVNTPNSIAAGQANLRAEVRPSPDVEVVAITVSKATLSNTL